MAISILSLAITGPLFIAEKGIASAIYARDQITASYLAQEAVEFVRNARDTNRIPKADGSVLPWLNGLSACTPVDDGSGTFKLQSCRIDARLGYLSPGAVTSCGGDAGGVCTPISFDSSTDTSSSGLYGYGIGSPTIFTRSVTIDTRASGKEAEVSVSVSWHTNLFSPLRTFTVKEYLFNF